MGLIRQEYWYKGNLSEHANVIFLQVNDELWHRFFIDAGDLFWKIVSSPDEADTTADEEFHYTHVDEMAKRSDLRGRTIEAVVAMDKGTSLELTVSELHVRLSGGVTLVLHNETLTSSDHSTFAIVDDEMEAE